MRKEDESYVIGTTRARVRSLENKLEELEDRLSSLETLPSNLSLARKLSLVLGEEG